MLAGKFEPVTHEMTYGGDYQPKPADQAKVPDIVANPAHPTGWVEPDTKQPLTFQAVGQAQPLTMVPLYKVIHDRYGVYWKVDRKTT